MAKLHIIRDEGSTSFDPSFTYCGLKGWRDRCGNTLYWLAVTGIYEVARGYEKPTCKKCLKARERTRE